MTHRLILTNPVSLQENTDSEDKEQSSVCVMWLYVASSLSRYIVDLSFSTVQRYMYVSIKNVPNACLLQTRKLFLSALKCQNTNHGSDCMSYMAGVWSTL